MIGTLVCRCCRRVLVEKVAERDARRVEALRRLECPDCGAELETAGLREQMRVIDAEIGRRAAQGAVRWRSKASREAA